MSNFPKKKGNKNNEVNVKKGLINSKNLERNVSIELSKEFLKKENKKKNMD